MKIAIRVVVAFDTLVLSVESYHHPNESLREQFLEKKQIRLTFVHSVKNSSLG